jgi:hypothetical protein
MTARQPPGLRLSPAGEKMKNPETGRKQRIGLAIIENGKMRVANFMNEYSAMNGTFTK